MGRRSRGGADSWFSLRRWDVLNASALDVDWGVSQAEGAVIASMIVIPPDVLV
jgi:hypothetical protein